jgi:hypothetical protein
MKVGLLIFVLMVSACSPETHPAMCQYPDPVSRTTVSKPCVLQP